MAALQFDKEWAAIRNERVIARADSREAVHERAHEQGFSRDEYDVVAYVADD